MPRVDLSLKVDIERSPRVQQVLGIFDVPEKKQAAISFNLDVPLEWLQPDWVLEPHVGRFSWRSPERRPSLDFEIVRALPQAWPWFAPHHYLSGELHRSARCFVGLVDGAPAAFGALLHMPHPRARNIWRIHRLVVLPDYQGLGIGAHAFPETLGAMCRSLAKRTTITTSHPALIKTWARSSYWRMTQKPALGIGHSGSTTLSRNRGEATRRRVATFEYVGPPLYRGSAEAREIASRLWT